MARLSGFRISPLRVAAYESSRTLFLNLRQSERPWSVDSILNGPDRSAVVGNMPRRRVVDSVTGILDGRECFTGARKQISDIWRTHGLRYGAADPEGIHYRRVETDLPRGLSADG